MAYRNFGGNYRENWDLRQFGQEFQEDWSGKPLPPDLWIGPYPGSISGDNVSGSVVVMPRDDGVPGSRISNSLMNQFSADPWKKALLYAIQRKGNFIPIYGTVGTTPVLIRPAEERTYLIVQNTSAANTLFVGIGYQPLITAGGATGLQLNAGGGAYEPAVIPPQDIWLVGSGAGTAFVVQVATG